MYYNPFSHYWVPHYTPSSVSIGSMYGLKEIPIEQYTFSDISGSGGSVDHTGTARKFLEDILSDNTPPDESGFFRLDAELGKDRVDLLVDLIAQQESIKSNNLTGLYQDIFYLDRMQKERPFPDNYKRDQIWLKLVEDKLKLYDSVRREIKDHAKMVSFLSKDVVNALLDLKQKRKDGMMFEYTPSSFDASKD